MPRARRFSTKKSWDGRRADDRDRRHAHEVADTPNAAPSGMTAADGGSERSSFAAHGGGELFGPRPPAHGKHRRDGRKIQQDAGHFYYQRLDARRRSAAGRLIVVVVSGR